MKKYKIEAFENLVEAFGALPSVGKKTAIRLAYHAVMEDGFGALKLAHG
jgi:recombination protein RecR